MGIISIIAQVIVIIFLLIFGLLSWQRPELIGSEFYWSKYKWFYIPNYRKIRNQQYQQQIRVLGIGILFSIPFVVLIVFL